MGENGSTSQRDGGGSSGGTRAWHALHLWQIQPLRDAMVVAAVLGVLYVGYLLSIVTVPLLLALLLAYLFEPLVKLMTRGGKIRRSFAAGAIIIITTLVIVVPASLALTFGLGQGARLAQTQLSNVQTLLRSVEQPDRADLRDALPGPRWRALQAWLVEQQERARAARESETPTAPPASDTVPSTSPGLGEGSVNTDRSGPVPPVGPEPLGLLDRGLADATEQALSFLREHAGEIGAKAVSAGAGAIGTVGRVAGSIGKFLFGGFLTLMFFYFFSVSWDRVLSFFLEVVPDKSEARVVELAKRMDRAIAGFVRGRITICACQIVLFTIGYWIIGVPAPLIMGPLVGLLTLAPYASGLGIPIAIALMFLDPAPATGMRGQWWWIVFAPMVIQGISQVLDDYILSPIIQGKNTDMSMPLILFASIAGGVLAGFYGLLVAIPVAACAKILVQELVLPRIKAWARGEVRDPLPFGGHGHPEDHAKT